MISTTKDMYDLLLYAVKKEHTSTIYPSQAVWLLNEGAVLWLKDNTKLVELNQREIDDLQDVRVTLHDVNPTSPNKYDLVSGSEPYFSLLNVMVRISDRSDCVDPNVYYKVDIRRSDNTAVIQNHPYRKPGIKNGYVQLYYDIKKGQLTVYGSVVNKFHIEYFTYIDEVTDVVSQSMSKYTEYILQEIVDVSARIYIERTQNPRYKTILNELTLKKAGE